MSSRNTGSRLGGGLIARKGEAAPTVPPAPHDEAARAAALASVQLVTAPPPATPRGTAGTIAVTLRLDPERYERLKIHGAKTRRTNQDILVEALDAFFDVKAS
jgi:hypothetical protein